MKRKLSVFILVLTLGAMAFSLVACNKETEYAKKLQKEGYSVVASEGKSYEPDNAGGYYAVYAERENDKSDEPDYVYIMIFDKKQDAERIFGKLIADIGGYGKIHRSGKVIIYGTEQGVKDARK